MPDADKKVPFFSGPEWEACVDGFPRAGKSSSLAEHIARLRAEHSDKANLADAVLANASTRVILKTQA